MKECSKCKTYKEPEDFYTKGGRLQTYCKPCFNRYCIDRWIRKKLEAIQYLGGCCMQCGYDKYYGALEFHHRDPSSKEFEWNKTRLLGKEAMLAEIDKCDLLCANCHRELHAR